MDDAEVQVRKSQSWRESAGLILLVVTIAAFLDNMLISTVAPILPQFLLELQLEKHQFSSANKTAHDASTEQTVLINGTAQILNLTTFSPPLNNSTADLSKMPDNATATLNDTHRSAVDGDGPDAAALDFRHKAISEESTELGVLLSSKPLVQLLINPFVGWFAHKFGNKRVMLSGFTVMFLSTLTFGYGNSYEILLAARCLQGVASSFTTIIGMTILAETYVDEKRRQFAMGLGLGGLGLGLSVGPPFGGITYQLLGRTAPFLILCGLIFIDGWLLFFSTHKKHAQKKKKVKQASMLKLVRDPYIMIVAAGVFLTCCSYTLVEATLPLKILEMLSLSRIQFGLIFLPYPVFFLFITTVTGKLMLKIKRWILSMIGIILTGLPLLAYPYCRNFTELLIPSAVMGVGAGMVDVALMPEIAYLVDIRHTSVYGNAFAIEDIAVCLGLTLGPLFGSFTYKIVGFTWIMVGGCTICLVYVPFIYLLKSPPIKNKDMALTETPAEKTLIQSTKDRENK